jgi:hypothetical protein
MIHSIPARPEFRIWGFSLGCEGGTVVGLPAVGVTVNWGVFGSTLFIGAGAANGDAHDLQNRASLSFCSPHAAQCFMRRAARGSSACR